MMETIKKPYELLARWDEEGILSGVHVQWRYITRDEGNKIVADGMSEVETVDIGSGKGFPLADILSQLHIDTLINLQVAQERIVEVKAERDELRGQSS